VIARRRTQGEPPLSLAELIELLTPVARALERAHNFSDPEGPVSIVHRDLKPENIFIADMAGERVVKILDFGIGIAKRIASQVAGRASQPGSGVASFTPAYGAPEQWSPKRYGQTGPWTDVWGLALTLVEALRGCPVIEGDNAAMMASALDPNRRPTPRNEGVQVSAAVERVFARALALDPRDRPAHAGAFWDALLDAAALPEEVQARRKHALRGAPTPAVGLPALELDFIPVSSPAPAAAERSPPSAVTRSDAVSHGEIELDTGDERIDLALDRPITRPSAATAASEPAPIQAGFAPRDAPVRRLERPFAQSVAGTAPSLAPEPSLARRMVPGAAALAGSIALTVADQAYAAYVGELLAIGPLRAVWLAALLLMAGVGLVVYALLPHTRK
jgi:serine/threonine-protein kinase